MKKRKNKKADYKDLYSSQRWRKLRERLFKENPLCVLCNEKGLVKAGRELDHIKPASMIDIKDFYNEDNLQFLCLPCHYRKTGIESSSQFIETGPDGIPDGEYNDEGYLIGYKKENEVK